ncbi:hypothetical protein [Pseudonocardia sp. McavD-2-B]|uniref:hypothetical protein n=1 Tax=Pseudonocardia sp. McavD-2-B TaxID=2954499 RepID=UPI0020976675|nr:hypothetical protein [Pseudonocardia sp. McavD-2-B]MCO7195400.1 hypothetical protein [Pseudonocardia sp. McavD-2-B]
MTEHESDELLADQVLDGRHPSVEHVARFLLVPNPNLPAPLYAIADAYAAHTRRLLGLIPDGPELTAALRDLLVSKDAAVRAAL